MIYVDTGAAASALDVSERALQASAKRGSDKYPYIYIEGKGRGGKKLLVGVSKTVLSEAMASGKVPNDVATWDASGLPVAFHPVQTCVSDSKDNQTHHVAVTCPEN